MGKKRFNLDESFNDVGNFIETPKEIPVPIENPTPPVQEAVAHISKPEIKEASYTIPDKKYRRNITLSEEQFRRLEFIKKSKNKNRDKEDELVTLDKLMFDMIQHCLDTQYPETKAMFEKYIKLKEMEDFADLM